MTNDNVSGNDITITQKDMIVSSTDRKGNIIYANDVFCNIAGYTREEVLNQPHNMIRHEDMPKAIFKLLWERVSNGQVIYAFVKNKAKNGDYYWVKAYVKPIVQNGEVVKMTSYRKPLNEYAKNFISKLYSQLVEYEKTHTVDESLAFLQNYLDDRGLTYDQFIDRLSLGKSVANAAAMNLDYNRYLNSHIIFKARYIDAVKCGKNEIEVQNKHDCELGTWLDLVKDESFTNTSEWRNVLKNHEQIHTLMEQYIHGASTGVSEAMLDTYLKQADECTDSLFNSIKKVIDNCEE